MANKQMRWQNSAQLLLENKAKSWHGMFCRGNPQITRVNPYPQQKSAEICSHIVSFMAYWLFKSEPGEWSWAQQMEAGEQGAEWDGVRNYLAQKHMKAMQCGDLGFFYHSVKEKQIVGIVEISALAHLDSTDTTGKWHCVDVAAQKPMPIPVTLAQIKAEPALATMDLVRFSRLSVQPVTPFAWQYICKMGGM